MSSVVSRDTIIAVLLIGLGTLGLLDTVFGEWRRGPGGGPKLFAQLCYVIFIGSGAMLLIEGRLKKDISDVATDQKLRMPAVVFFAAGSLYFYLVLNIGLIASTFVYTVTMFTILNPSNSKNLVRTLLISLVVIALIWLLFTQVINLILPDPLLF